MDDVEAPLLTKKHSPSSQLLGIIGTGDYARALTRRLVFSGYDVVLGSRRPEARHVSLSEECLCGVELTSVAECLRRCQVIFIAIHSENFQDCLAPYAGSCEGKVFIDVSNRENRYASTSNAEYLRSVVPKATVVKAFNVVSAHAMEHSLTGGSRKIFVASNSPAARRLVCDLALNMGFAPVDLGGLKAAWNIEAFVLHVFPGSRIPIFLTVGIFNLWVLYIVYIYFIEKSAYRWDQIFVKVLNKPLCMTGITVLSLTYLPSSLAAFLQIYNGTKHKRFPKWFDTWLRSRKQLGLIAFVLVCVHVLMSVLLMSPTYYRSWFQSTVVVLPGNMTQDLRLPFQTWMIWKGEAACLVGIIAFVIMCILAVTSLPSVSESMNWVEWRFVQSKLGYVMLFLSVLHVVIMGSPSWAKADTYKIFRSITMLSILLPITVLLLRLLLSLPPLSGYVRKIRRGWERGQDCAGTYTLSADEHTSFKSTQMNAICCCENDGHQHCGASADPQRQTGSCSCSSV